MLHLLNSILKTKVLISVVAFLGCYQLSYGQFITGPTTVDTDSTHWYSYQDGITYSSLKWGVVGATNLSIAIQSGSVFNAQVQFPSTVGTATITIKYGRIILATSNVTIQAATPPPTPPPLPDSNLSSNQNYIHTVTPTVETTDVTLLANENKIESVVYFDGIGRPIESISIRSGGYGEDITTHIEYDGQGRQEKDYLPYAIPSDGGLYRTDALSPTKNYYKTIFPDDFIGILEANINPYSQKDLEASPLSRVLKQAAPGEDWKQGNDHEIEFSYLTNSASEVKKFSVIHSLTNNTYTPSLSGGTAFYNSGKLYKTITKDENHTGTTKNNTTEEFKNKQGQILLKRTYNNGIEHDTYYVYDDYGRLTYVLPPKMDASSETLPNIINLLNDLGYQYVYDNRSRLVEKRIPGKGWEYIVYNKLNQPVMTQDPNLNYDGKWLFTKYDALGRIAYTGLDSNNTSSRSSEQTGANGTTLQNVERTTNVNTNAGTNMYYNNDAYPSSYDEIHTINYFDSYIDLPSGLNNTATTYYGLTSSTKTKGLPTVSKVRVLGTNDWITTVSYYDAKGRAIYVYSVNDYLGTTDIIESDLDFTGKPNEVKTTHTKAGNTIITKEVFTYDHADRLTKQTHEIDNSGNIEVIAQNTYDGLGQLISKKVGNTTTTPLQTVDYNYNVRGWLKGINDLQSLGTKLFAFGINYNTINYHTTNDKKLFNGNISETEWKTSNDNTLRWYKYEYDNLNRITSATDNISRYNLSGISYDKNGNIKTLIREGHIVSNPVSTNGSDFGTMDNLTYNYNNGNQLLKVSDSANSTYGFKDGTNTLDDFTYDVNGNILRDYNKDMNKDIEYNHLNLPQKIYFAPLPSFPSIFRYIEYIYDANGVKLSRKVYDTSTWTPTTTITEYAGNYVYENSSLKFFNHSEGYVEPDGSGGYDYIYQYKDHLGNIRLNYKNTGTTSAPILQIQEENNYYPFGLKHKGYNNAPLTNHPYKYQGQELNESLDYNMYEFELRHYDAAIGRFVTTDPYEQFMSPYLAMGNNPVVSFDPDGGLCYDSNGNQITCPDDDIYDEYRDNEDSHITILDEVDLDAPQTYKEWYDIYVKPLREAAKRKVKEEWMDDFYKRMNRDRMGAMQLIGIYLLPLDIAELATIRTVATVGDNIVYRSVTIDGVVNYVGITNNLVRRAAQHLAKKGIRITPLMRGLSRADARAVEQALIEIHKLGKNGGTLLNKINSIAATNPRYAKALKRGYELLRSIGYKF
jgi:RHS repeat-associated protein